MSLLKGAKLVGSRERWFLAYKISVVGLFVAYLIFEMTRSTWPGWQFIFFFALTMAAESLPVDLPRYKGTISVSFVVIYAAVLIMGPGWGMLIASLGTVCRSELGKATSFPKIAFNRSQLGLAAGLSGLMFITLGGTPGAVDVGRDIMALIAGGVAYMVINFGLVAIYVSLHLQMPIAHVWEVNLRWSIPHSLALLPVAFLLAAVYESVGVLGVLFFVFPLLVGRHSYTMYHEMRSMFLSTIEALAAALEAKDPYTHGHAERVARLAVHLARELKMPEGDIDMLAYVGTLHDVGKIGIHDSVLKKPGRFTREEYEEMKTHPEIGARIIRDVRSLSQGAAWIQHHHEHYDGSGYPKGLSGEDIPLGARILAAADSFDAMVSGRPYQAARTIEEACLEVVRCAGSQFDPLVVEKILEVCRNDKLMVDIFGRAHKMPASMEAAATTESHHPRIPSQ